MPFGLLRYGLSRRYPAERHIPPRPDLRHRYDVVIIGGGGHGLAVAYYLARDWGIRNVAVLDKGWLGGGNTGRNTTIIRANYLTPEGVRFYAASLARHNISINALRIGSVVLKPRAEPFWTSVPEVVKGLNEATPAGHLLTSGEVGQFMARLVSAGFAGMTGQTITLDGGASLRDGIQMVRHALEGGHGLA